MFTFKVESRRSKAPCSSPPRFLKHSSPGFQRPGSKPLLAAILAAFITASAVAAAHQSVLRGTVLDPSGRPVPGARVSLLAPLAALDERQTDSEGQFEFTGLRPGTYKLAANSPGFSASSVEVDLRESEMRTVTLRLELSAVHEQVVVSA